MADFLLSLAKDLLGNPVLTDRRNSKLSSMMRELKNTFPVIGTLEDVELQQLKDEHAKKWLNCVKDVCYDVIDVFEECSILRMKLQKQKKVGLLSFSHSFFNHMRQSIADHDAAMMIMRLIEKIDLVKKNESLLNLPLRRRGRNPHWEVVPPRIEPLKTISLVDKEMIFGRDSDTNTLTGKLLHGSNQEQSIYYLSIVGIGGIGKTTLAQLLYNSEEVKNHFELKAWISVPQEEFYVEKILRKILLSVAVESYPKIGVESDLRLLMPQFRQIIGGKRFLFVLDYMWSDNYSCWELLKYAFECGAPGSAILITTRSTQVAHNAGSANIWHLGGLSENDSWAMFRHLVFGALPDKIEIETSLEELGRQIINKCHGVPAAVRAVGGLLSTKRSVEDWQQVLLEFETFSEIGDSLISTLMLSYCHLSPQLRQCLLFCSIFPKNHSIDVDKLIKLWMAQNFVASRKDDMEREGQHCFEGLLSYSFFQDLRRDNNGNLLCNMHSLLTDFIKLLAEKECSIMHVDQNTEIERGLSFQEGRHWTLSVAGQASLPIFIRYSEKVHTLIIMSEYSFVDPTSLSKLLHHFERLRALDLSHCLLRELPLKVGKLLHLRYLDLSFNRDLKELPEAICDLLLLQTLNLNGCDNLQKLPNGIGNLVFLRHLEILWTKCLSYLPKGIRSLTSLRTLNRFFGSGVVGSRASDLGDLENLSYLQGYISIDGLGGVTDVALAEKAALKNKKNLFGMDLWFSGVASNKKDGAVLEALEPPPNLKSLGIFYFRGTSLPHWMAAMKQLRHLMLSDCSGCEVLPTLGKLPLLESLEIRNMISVRKVGPEFFGIESDLGDGSKKVFPQLKKLNFHNLTNWEEWDEITRRGDNVTIMPELSSLSIVKCSKIRAVPDYIKRIQNLSCHIEECPLLNQEKSAENWED